MEKNILISSKQAAAFNAMLKVLNRIANEYSDPTQLLDRCEVEYGIDYEDALEMAYENIQGEAQAVINHVEPLYL